MIVSPEKFSFTYLPDYANFLLENKLEEFVTVGIRLCREADLPLLKPLNKFSEQELVQLSMATNKELLTAIVQGKIAEHIEKGLTRYASNTIGYIDKEDLLAEDLSLGFYLRRKIFSYFLDTYTQDNVLQKHIIAEVDAYTTQEELLAYSIFIRTKQEQLSVHTDLLLETQRLAGIGSYFIDFRDPTKTFFTPEYLRIIECDVHPPYEKFLTFIHPEDRSRFKNKIDHALAHGGEIDVEFRYQKESDEKYLRDIGSIRMEDGKAVLAIGSITDITERQAAMKKLLETQTLYQLGQRLNRTGNWLWNLETGLLRWSDEMYAMFEVDNGRQMTLGEFLAFVHVDDRRRVQDAIEKGTDSDYIFRIITGNRNEKTLKGVSKTEFTKQKIIAQCYGTCQDISSQSSILPKLQQQDSSQLQ